MRVLVIVLLSGLGSLLSGCSSNGDQPGANLKETDHEYVNAVNREARFGGVRKVDVYWVNPPQKRKDEDKEPLL